MDRIVGVNTIDLGGGRRGFRGKDTVAGLPGTELAASWHNQIQEEIVRAIEAGGDAPAGDDVTQLLKTISKGINLGAAGGSANALTATIPGGVVLPSLQAGMRFTIKFGANANTGPATLDLAGFTIDPAAIAIVRNDNGAALEGGELIGWGQILFDGAVYRLLSVPRLRTPRVIVPAGGVTITAKDEYTTFVMDLAVRQVQPLPSPNSVPVGFSTKLEVTGTPSGFQTAYVNVAGGGNLFYRGNGATNFFLIGGGEVFEFISTGTMWLVRLVSPPANVGVYRTASGQPATIALPSVYGDINLDTVSGSRTLFQLTPSTIRLPVTGVYNIYGAVGGYNNVAAWDDLDICIFDNTASLVSQAVETKKVYNSFSDKARINYTQAYPAGTRLILTARGPGGNVIAYGNASEFSAFLTGR